LPKDRAGYGLIHQDAHGGNFFIKDGAITLFDFDDCMYGWFIYDIAMVLFYAALGKEDMAAFTKTFMGDFLQGYAQENMLDPPWLPEIPHFLKLREIDLYAIIHPVLMSKISMTLGAPAIWLAAKKKSKRMYRLSNLIGGHWNR